MADGSSQHADYRGYIRSTNSGVGEQTVDRLKQKTSPSQSATQPQTAKEAKDQESLQMVEIIGSGGEDRTLRAC